MFSVHKHSPTLLQSNPSHLLPLSPMIFIHMHFPSFVHHSASVRRVLAYWPFTIPSFRFIFASSHDCLKGFQPYYSLSLKRQKTNALTLKGRSRPVATLSCMGSQQSQSYVFILFLIFGKWKACSEEKRQCRWAPGLIKSQAHAWIVEHIFLKMIYSVRSAARRGLKGKICHSTIWSGARFWTISILILNSSGPFYRCCISQVGLPSNTWKASENHLLNHSNCSWSSALSISFSCLLARNQRRKL